MTTILRADALLTPAGEVTGAGGVELEFNDSGVITYVGVTRQSCEQPPTQSAEQPAEIIDLMGHVLMPGLVNGHTHSAMTLQRGVSDNDGFMPWLTAVQAVEQGLTHADVVAGLQLAMVEMIASGTTTFADMYHWDEALLEQVRSAGMRVFAAPAMFTNETVGFPGVRPWNGAEVLDETERLAQHYAADPQIRIGYGPHAPYTCSPELLAEIRERSLRSGVPIHIHIAESVAETTQIVEQYGTTSADHLDRLGFFDARVHAAHCVHLTEAEIEVFARTGTSVSHNPVSNLKLGCGVAKLPELLEAGVSMALGTDSVASNNSLDLFEEIKLATILHRGVRHDAAAITAAQVLDIATRGGAHAIGFTETGSLEVGKLADVIALAVTGPQSTPRGSLESHLAFTATGHDVQHVFIGGRQVYAYGAHLTLDVADITQRVRAAAKRLR